MLLEMLTCVFDMLMQSVSLRFCISAVQMSVRSIFTLEGTDKINFLRKILTVPQVSKKMVMLVFAIQVLSILSHWDKLKSNLGLFQLDMIIKALILFLSMLFVLLNQDVRVGHKAVRYQSQRKTISPNQQCISLKFSTSLPSLWLSAPIPFAPIEDVHQVVKMGFFLKKRISNFLKTAGHCS